MSIRTSNAPQGLPRGIYYVADASDGYWRRRRRGRHVIVDGGGAPCTEPAVLERVEQMVIPPQWENVWICRDGQGHLQCTGRDQRGRKQYIYHADYVAYRQRAKFDKVIRFAERLPELRAHVAELLARKTWDHDRMLGLVVRMLDHTHLRIGSARYAAENDTYGLTTLRRKHLSQDGRRGLELAFQGKSGKFRQVTIKNRQLRKLIKQVADLPGYELFKYRDEEGRAQRLDSGDVNDFLHEVMGDCYSAKDFRTWGGTSLAVKEYHAARLEHEAGGGKGKLTTKLVRRVARELGNTVSVCREYYIHPDVLARAEARELPDHDWDEHEAEALELAPYEQYTLDLLQGNC